MIVKCKLCGTPHDRKLAYTPTGKTPYYCSEQEYNEELNKRQFNMAMRSSTYTLLHDDILNYDKEQIINSKKLEELGKHYGWNIVFQTFIHCEKDIKFAVQQKGFDNEFIKLNYIMAIISNHINDIYIKQKNEKTKKEVNTYVDIDMLNDSDKPIYKKTNDISQFI